MTSPPASDATFLPSTGLDWLLPLYDPLAKLLRFETHHRDLLGQASLDNDLRVLEVGCGTGNLVLLAKRLHPGADITGVDPDPKALTRAHRKTERAGVSVALDHGFAEKLPYPAASFDRVLSAFMFHHLRHNTKRAMLAEAMRVLRPGGSLHLVDFGGPTIDHDDPSHGQWLSHLFRRRHHHGQHNHDDRVHALFQQAGFADVAEVGHRGTIVGPARRYRAGVSHR